MKENRRAIKNVVTEINIISKSYLDYINSFGNPCAYSDRIIEEIIAKAKNLEKIYNEQFKEN